jgi:hypothetical protein
MKMMMTTMIMIHRKYTVNIKEYYYVF